MAANGEESTPNGHGPARATPGNRAILPQYLVQFLDLLRKTGNVSFSARTIGWSRSTVYNFAGKNPSFREAMREAMSEGRELLVAEGWKRATTWSEYLDSKNGFHIKPPSDRLLAILIAGYFQEFKPGRDEDVPADVLLPETADLTQLDDKELDALERILVKAGASELGTRED